MFSILSNLTKAVVKTAILPVSIAVDVATLGGTLTDSGRSMTAQNLKEIGKNIDKAMED